MGNLLAKKVICNFIECLSAVVATLLAISAVDNNQGIFQLCLFFKSCFHITISPLVCLLAYPRSPRISSSFNLVLSPKIDCSFKLQYTKNPVYNKQMVKGDPIGWFLNNKRIVCWLAAPFFYHTEFHDKTIKINITQDGVFWVRIDLCMADLFISVFIFNNSRALQ